MKLMNLMKKFHDLKIDVGKASEQFHHFIKFLERIAPVLRDLTRSYRESNWKLHLSVLR